MTLQEGLLLSALAFLGTHFLLSHQLRAPLVRALGEGPFRGIYVLVALVTFGSMVWFYNAIGREPPLFVPGDVAWFAASLLMWIASILLVGSFVRNPAFPGSKAAPVPTGVFRITRHPMMWSFALWAIVHGFVVAMPKSLVLDGAILLLALGGSAAQDHKKRRLMGERWEEWTEATGFIPFSRGLAWPGTFAAVGGTIVFFLVTWLHPIPAGFWRWIG